MPAASIVPESFGLRFTMEGFPNPEDLAGTRLELPNFLANLSPGWGALVDLRLLRAFSAEAADMVKQQIYWCLEHGMERSAVLTESALATRQAQCVLRDTGLGLSGRLFEPMSCDDPEAGARSWLDAAA